MNLSHSENIILHILDGKDGKPGLGKTAVMKIVYLLQQVKQMELGYDFDIYTYGPYAPEVTDHLDTLISNGFISSMIYNYNNYVGYQLNISESGRSEMKEISNNEKSNIQDILNFTDGKSAKTLELYSTIIFIKHLYLKNKILCDQENDVISKVHEIKPHFGEETISEAYNVLSELKYI